MPCEEADDDHDEDDARHYEDSRERLLYLRENDPEYDVQKHDLDREPHLVVYEEDAEEAADYRADQ